MTQTATENFFAAIPAFTLFNEVGMATHYRSLPGDWIIGVADVVDSTGAIGRGQYKAVNMVGASIISAVINRLGHRDFPFVFSGDGAAFAVPVQFEYAIREVAAAVQTWAEEEMGLTLRAAIVPLREILNAGYDVTVARFSVAPELAYAMFSGGGINWAETEMKAGRYLVERAAPDVFAKLIGSITRYIDDPGRTASPVQPDSLRFTWPPKGLGLEARAARGKISFVTRYAALVVFTLFGWILFRFNLKFFGFDPKLYRADTTRNSDFRKFDDGLKLTLDTNSEAIEQLTSMLEEARRNGIAFYGVHRQRQALMTCLVPSVLMRDHVHFIDGAGGGYAKAADSLDFLDMPQNFPQTQIIEIDVFGYSIRLPELRRYRKFYDKLRAGKWEARTFQVLGKHLDEQTHYVDIGAWIGVTAFWASHVAKSVIAVEPDPDCIEILRQLSPSYPKVKVLEGALARGPDIRLHAVGDFGSSETSALNIGEGPSVLARGLAIEEIMRQAGAGPVFVKIDIEGYEYEMASEIAKLRSYDLRAVQCAVHPQLLEKSQTGPLPLRRFRTLVKTWQFRRLLPGYRAVPGRRYSSFISYLTFGIALRRVPRGTDLVYCKQA